MKEYARALGQAVCGSPRVPHGARCARGTEASEVARLATPPSTTQPALCFRPLAPSSAGCARSSAQRFPACVERNCQSRKFSSPRPLISKPVPSENCARNSSAVSSASPSASGHTHRSSYAPYALSLAILLRPRRCTCTASAGPGKPTVQAASHAARPSMLLLSKNRMARVVARLKEHV